ncbi:MAG: hypothetical protein QM652_00045 [Legionella sp.]|uniref:hypothetical protein n=1 Tax=Legionella sp. TaxID=459 RepID=UPI0039E5DE76
MQKKKNILNRMLRKLNDDPSANIILENFKQEHIITSNDLDVLGMHRGHHGNKFLTIFWDILEKIGIKRHVTGIKVANHISAFFSPRGFTSALQKHSIAYTLNDGDKCISSESTHV